ncbi:unnamed protein product [Musa textilis]
MVLKPRRRAIAVFFSASAFRTIPAIPSLLQECRSLEDLESVHATMLKRRALRDSFLMNQFVAACSRLHLIDYALRAFVQMPDPNVFVYNAVVGGLLRQSESTTALELYVGMLRSDVLPDGCTFSHIVKACARSSATELGQAVHGQIVKMGFGTHLLLQTALVDFYSSSEKINESSRLFDEMSERDVVSWTVMILGHARLGDLASARRVFDEMPDRSIVSWNTLIAGYGRSGDVESAVSLFDEMPEKSLVSWTTMISCYSQNKRYKEAIKTFDSMKAAGVGPDRVAMATVISACAHLGALDLGRELHLYVMLNGFDLGVHLGSALIDMYAKCGSAERALVIFYKLEEKNIFCWNSVIEGLAIHGCGRGAINMFHKMNAEGNTQPNGVTFVSVLSACNHAGLVEESRLMFSSMIKDYLIRPEKEHYGCMVDLLGRAGHLVEALNLIRSMPMAPNAAIWSALLSGCRIHRNMEVAEIAAEKLLVLEPEHSAHYMLLVNMHAEAKAWEKAGTVRGMLEEKGVQKRAPGCSWIEIDGVVQEFAACDMIHLSSKICSVLHELDGQLKLAGCSSQHVCSPELDISLMLRFLCAKAERRHVLEAWSMSRNGLVLFHRVFVEKIRSSRPYSSALALSCLHHQFFSSERLLELAATGESKKKYEFYNSRGRSLFPFVSFVASTMNWEVARKMSFSIAVNRFGLSQSLESFAVLIHTFLSAGMHKEVKHLLRDIAEYNRSVGSNMLELLSPLASLLDGAMRSQAYESLIYIFAEASMLEDALETFLESKQVALQLSIRSCNFLLKCLVERKMIEYARSLFQALKNSGPSPNVYTYSIMMGLYATGDILYLDEAKGILLDMEKVGGVRPNAVTYATYIRGLCSAGYVEPALGFLRDLQHKCLPLNAYCFNAVIHGFCQEGRPSESLKVFEMKGCGFPPDVHSYSMLIDGFCKQGDVSKGYDLIVEMVNCGTLPTMVSYSSLLYGLCRIGEVKVALNLFRELRHRGCRHDQISYSILLDGYCQHGDLDGACALWEDMIKNNFVPDVYNYTSLIHGFCRHGHLKEALAQFQVMIKKGIMPNIVTCTVLVDGFFREHYVDQALMFLNEVRGMGITPNLCMYRVVVNGLCKGRMSEKAWEVFGDMIKRGLLPDVVIYSTLIEGFAKMLNMEEAFKVYAKMSKQGVTPNIFTYTSLINGLCNDGRMPEALNLFEEMVQRGLMPDRIAFTSLIANFCKCKNMNKALEWFNKMMQSGLAPDVFTYTCLIYGYSKLLSMDIAVSLMDEMLRIGVRPNLVTYTALISGYCKIGERKKAYELYKIMLKQGILPDMLACRSLGLDCWEVKT